MRALVHLFRNMSFVHYTSWWSLAEEGNDYTKCSPLMYSVKDVLWSTEVTL